MKLYAGWWIEAKDIGLSFYATLEIDTDEVFGRDLNGSEDDRTLWDSWDGRTREMMVRNHVDWYMDKMVCRMSPIRISPAPPLSDD